MSPSQDTSDKLFLGNVFPYYLRSLPNITVLQSLMDKDLSIACYAKVRFSSDGNIDEMAIFDIYI